MSQVQAATIEPILGGTDFIVRAKTGTGKTIAYLAPSIDRIAKQLEATPLRDNGAKILALVIAPTRELAEQIATECAKLTRHHDTLRQVCVYGGHSLDKDVSVIAEQRPNILIGTPGRLLDLLTNSEGFVQKFSDVCFPFLFPFLFLN
jgi:ATP-dependent RNA helicase MSS116